MAYKVYASEDYVKEYSVAKDQGIDNTGKILGVDTQGKVSPLNYVNNIVFRDATTGINYIGFVDNGEWVLAKKIERIEVASLPNRLTYLVGEEVDITGIVVNAVFADGNTFEINDYTYKRSESNNNEIIISYEQIGIKYTTSFELNVIDLVDFVYTTDENHNYTITDWKGTYNGVASTKCIIPNSEKIIVNLD